MNRIENLAQYFEKFPGIGQRQAKRFVYFLLSKDSRYIDEITRLMKDIKQDVRQCTSCFRFFENTGSNECTLCTDPKRDITTLLIVEKDADLENIKRSGAYNGSFFVLGGLVPIVEKKTARKVRTEQLLERIKSKSINEVILAFSLSPQGDHTDVYIRSLLSPLEQEYGFTIRSLGRGLSTGTELEYSDGDTIIHALKNRH